MGYGDRGYRGCEGVIVCDSREMRAMYNGDRSRKEKLVEYGWRLPSALDNSPL